MTAIKDLPAQLRAALIYECGFKADDDVSHLSLSNPAMGDMPRDGQISFVVIGRGYSDFVVVGKNDQVMVYENRQLINAVTAPDISYWASKIDPLKETATASSSNCAIRSECEMDKKAHRSIRVATGRDSDAPYKGKRVVDRPFATSALAELADLPLGHPAREFGQIILKDFAEAAGKLSPAKGTDEGAIGDVRIAFVRRTMDMWGMKSAKVFYDAGVRLWKEFPNIRDTEDRPVNILYPGAGANVGALSTAMALIDQGAPCVTMTFTDLDETLMAHARGTIKGWASVNPYMEVLSDFEPIAPLAGGARSKCEIMYKGKNITLIYAIKDSPGDLYFHPDTLASSDMVMINDPYSGMGESDELLLPQIIPQILKYGGPPKAILIPDSQDTNLKSSNKYARKAVLPLQGWPIIGSYGHGEGYAIRKKEIRELHIDIPEIGPSHVKSGWLFSTGQTLVETLDNRERADNFVGLSMWAGGRISPLFCLPNGDAKLDCVPSRSSGKMVPENVGTKEILAWLELETGKLGKRDSDALLLTALRMLLMRNRNCDYMTGISFALENKLFGVMVEYGLISSEERLSVSDIVNKNMARDVLDSNFESNPMLEKIDKALAALRFSPSKG